MATPVLKEKSEQIIFADWARQNGVMFTHVPNELDFHSQEQMFAMITKRKRLGVSNGFPDLMVYIPAKSEHAPYLLFIELKRSDKKLSRVSKEQVAWLKLLNTVPNVKGVVAYGAREAIKVVKSLL